MVTPKPSTLEWVSASRAWRLTRCAYRILFELDPRFAGWSRHGERAALGIAAHGLMERVWRGEADDPTTPADAWLEAAWAEGVAAEHARLREQWQPAASPPPDGWPGYSRTKVLLLRSLQRQIIERRQRPKRSEVPRAVHSEHGTMALPAVELELRDPLHRLYGRPDRIDRVAGELRVVDLKSTGPQQDERGEKQRFQLVFYAGLVEAVTGECPSVGVILEPSGKEHATSITQSMVDEVRKIVALCRESVESSSEIEGLAQPSSQTCMYCPFAVVCAPFTNAWQSDWKVNFVSGRIASVATFPTGLEIGIEQSRLFTCASKMVRLTGLPEGQSVSLGAELSASFVDVLGPDVVRARWNTRLWVNA